MALAGDFNWDGIVEIVVPDQNMTSLNGIEWQLGGLARVWNIPLEARLTTNLAAITTDEDDIALGAGLESGVLAIWLP